MTSFHNPLKYTLPPTNAMTPKNQREREKVQKISIYVFLLVYLIHEKTRFYCCERFPRISFINNKLIVKGISLATFVKGDFDKYAFFFC